MPSSSPSSGATKAVQQSQPGAKLRQSSHLRGAGGRMIRFRDARTDETWSLNEFLGPGSLKNRSLKLDEFILKLLSRESVRSANGNEYRIISVQKYDTMPQRRRHHIRMLDGTRPRPRPKQAPSPPKSNPPLPRPQPPTEKGSPAEPSRNESPSWFVPSTDRSHMNWEVVVRRTTGPRIYILKRTTRRSMNVRASAIIGRGKP